MATSSVVIVWVLGYGLEKEGSEKNLLACNLCNLDSDRLKEVESRDISKLNFVAETKTENN